MSQPNYSKDSFEKLSIPTGAVAITPSDSTDLVSPGTLYLGVTGNLVVTVRDGGDVTFSNVPVGFFPVNVSRVKSTGTTATSIVALY